MSTTIGSVVLQGIGPADAGSGGDLQWLDEFGDGSDLVGQVESVSITGAVIYQASAQQSGRRLTLAGGREGEFFFGLLTRAEVEALRALAAVPGEEYAVTLPDGRELTAIFRRSDGPAITAEPVQHIVPHQAGDLYLPTIRMVLT